MQTNKKFSAALAIAFIAVVLSLAVACNDNDDEPAASLEKWPADYPITGDSIVNIYVSLDGQAIGVMSVTLYPDSAPNHVRNVKWLANQRFYDGLLFHRVIRDFVIQGGDPTGTGSGGAPWTVEAEFNGIPHVRGIVSMARSFDPNSARSQFFIVHGDSFPHLDRQYTVFGRLLSGFEALDSIANVPTTGSEHSTPQIPVVMDSVRISPVQH